MSDWSPKPLNRPTLNQGSVSSFVEREYVVKGRSPMQRQRDADGTPYTRGNVTVLRPADPKLYIGNISKACKADLPDEDAPDIKKSREIVKSYLAAKGYEQK